MLKLVAIAPILFAPLGSCNEERFVTSTSEKKPPHKDDAEANPKPTKTPPPPVDSEELPTPKHWPECWLSSRLSTMTAFRIAGFSDNAYTGPLHKSSDGRQELTGESQNPHTTGKCVLNWFGQDHSQEPWVLQLQETPELQGMHAALTCIADKTPNCRCAALLPQPPYTDQAFELIIGLCVEDAPDGGHEIYHVKDPSRGNTVPAAGKCVAALADSIASRPNTRDAQEIFLQQNKDTTATGTKQGISCRTDIEPFAPLDDEKGWYAHKDRDWAITTCTDNTTGCRCYVTYNKSGQKDKERSMTQEYNSCLLCADDTCQQARLNTLK